MASLLALDFPLGPALVDELVECAMTSQAFCILDQRLSPRAREEALRLMGATHIRDENGTVALEGGCELEDGDALVMLTSGSSGTPKAAIHTWASLLASAEITQSALRGADTPVWVPCLPPAHIGGLSVLLRSVLNDAELRWPDNPGTGPREGATHIAVVRAQLSRYELGEYACVLLGGAKAPEHVANNVIATWGLTETASGIVYDGRALAHVRVKAIRGELCVQSPTLFRAYRDAPRPAYVDDEGTWFPTGDGGSVDDGQVRVQGRLQFVISTGGEKVWPEDLEKIFAAVDGLNDVAITGVDDPEWGQRVVALVVSARSVDEELRARAIEHLGPWAVPKEIRYVTAIPRTSNGKIRRSALVNLF